MPDTLEEIARPELTLPEAEAAWLRAAYEGAETILEYGAGGSTIMAGEMPGKRVFAVESDRDWAAQMEGWFAAHPPASQVTLVPVWVGPVRKWGMPRDESAWARYPRYPLAVWDREDLPHPDVVLIDGRFRAGCLLAALYRAERPLTVYFDDYVPRTRYHVVEEFVAPVETRGRMAKFEIEPREVEKARLLQIAEILYRRH